MVGFWWGRWGSGGPNKWNSEGMILKTDTAYILESLHGTHCFYISYAKEVSRVTLSHLEQKRCKRARDTVRSLDP